MATQLLPALRVGSSGFSNQRAACAPRFPHFPLSKPTWTGPTGSCLVWVAPQCLKSVMLFQLPRLRRVWHSGNALYKPGMQLFEGERKEDGSIDWVNPKALDNFLIPVDIYSLNFYPPDYENTLEELCYDVKDKSFTDSLYYSFSHLYSLNNEPIQIVDTEVNFESDSVAYTYEYDAIIDSSRLYINPAKIKSIWSKEFNNTLLATREFEKRLKVIFGTCNGLILDLYINNLDKNMR